MIEFLRDLHFLRPAWLLALLVLPLLLGHWHRRRQQADPWRHICDPQLLPWLRQDAAGQARGSLPAWLAGIGLGLTILALAGPAFRQAPQTMVQLQSPLIVAVDLSNRMLATDLKPSRMARMRFKLADLMTRRKEGQTGLIAYAGDAFTVAPLTDDAASLRELAAALSPGVMPVQGQAAARAIDLAVKLLQDAGHAHGDLLLLTDQADARARAAAQRALATGLRVSVLGVGTAQGAPVPLADGGFLLDARGNILIPKVDASGLAALARAGGGRYVELGVDDADLRALGVLEARADAGESDSEAASGLIWRDEGPWLLLLLLPLAALVFRRGWAGCVLLILLLPPPAAQALDWSSLWQRADQRAWQALQDGQAEAARELARDPALAGAAAYRAGDYVDAVEQFAEADDATAHYNRGNALARAAHYPEAIAAYDEALARDPELADAATNRKAVEDWLRQQESQDPQQGGDQNRQEGGDQDRKPPDGAADPTGSEPPEQDDDQESGAPEDAGDEQDGDASGQQPEPQPGESTDQEDADSSRGQQDAQPDADTPDRSRSTDPDGENRPDAPSEADQPSQDDAEQYARQMQEALAQADAEPDAPMPTEPLSTEEAEQQQAMEHLLRRVPDDPGGLLRRKFQLEYQRRQQQGDRR